MTQEINFDIQAAWLRRFKEDAQSNLRAFALRLKEAMPELVTIHEARGFFSTSGKVTGVTAGRFLRGRGEQPVPAHAGIVASTCDNERRERRFLPRLKAGASTPRPS